MTTNNDDDSLPQCVRDALNITIPETKKGATLVRLTKEELQALIVAIEQDRAKVQNALKEGLDIEPKTRFYLYTAEGGSKRVSTSSFQRDETALFGFRTRDGRHYIPLGYFGNLFLLRSISMTSTVTVKRNKFKDSLSLARAVARELKKTMLGPDFDKRVEMLCQPTVLESYIQSLSRKGIRENDATVAASDEERSVVEDHGNGKVMQIVQLYLKSHPELNGVLPPEVATQLLAVNREYLDNVDAPASKEKLASLLDQAELILMTMPRP